MIGVETGSLTGFKMLGFRHWNGKYLENQCLGLGNYSEIIGICRALWFGLQDSQVVGRYPDGLCGLRGSKMECVL